MITILFLLLAVLALFAGVRPMANLTADTPRTWRGERSVTTMNASGALCAGAAVEEDGNGRLQNGTGAGTTFAGFLLQSATAVDDRVDVADKTTVRLPVAKATNWALTDIGATVYLSDGATFTLTSTSNQAIGKVVEIESGIGSTSAVVWVYVEGQGKRSL